jgi:hypothetical protein
LIAIKKTVSKTNKCNIPDAAKNIKIVKVVNDKKAPLRVRYVLFG